LPGDVPSVDPTTDKAAVPLDPAPMLFRLDAAAAVWRPETAISQALTAFRTLKPSPCRKFTPEPVDFRTTNSVFGLPISATRRSPSSMMERSWSMDQDSDQRSSHLPRRTSARER